MAEADAPTTTAATAGTIHLREHFDQPQAEVWDALVDPDRLSAWLGGPCRIEANVGGAVRFDVPDDGVAATGVVRSVSGPRPGMAVASIEHTFVDVAHPGLAAVCVWSVVRDERDPDAGCDLHLVMEGADDAARAFGDRLGGADTRPATSLDAAAALLAAARRVLLVDWLGPDTPRELARRVPELYAKVGPRDDDWARIEPSDDDGGFRTVRGPRPERVDLLHLDWTLGFDEFVRVAAELGAATFWYHSGRTRPPAPADDRGCWVPPRQSARQRAAVEALGLAYVDDVHIVDVARHLAP
jgi:hypothetical protein